MKFKKYWELFKRYWRLRRKKVFQVGNQCFTRGSARRIISIADGKLNSFDDGWTVSYNFEVHLKGFTIKVIFEGARETSQSYVDQTYGLEKQFKEWVGVNQ